MQNYAFYAEEDAVSWIRSPHGYSQRNRKLHSESDFNCWSYDCFAGSPSDLLHFEEMQVAFDSALDYFLHITGLAVGSPLG